jgi:hypothetical protein
MNANVIARNKETRMKARRQEKAGNLTGSSTSKSQREQIEERAYELWLAGGGAHGNDVDHWLQAEREVLEGQEKP